MLRCSVASSMRVDKSERLLEPAYQNMEIITEKESILKDRCATQSLEAAPFKKRWSEMSWTTKNSRTVALRLPDRRISNPD